MMTLKVKLFSSALAIGMLLGTGISALPAAQHASNTTITARASTRDSTTVALKAAQIQLDDDGYITHVEWEDGQRDALLNGGILEIPEKGQNGEVIRGVGESDNLHGIFAKYALYESEESEGQGIKKVSFEKPENIKYIGNWAFYGNQLTEISLPNAEAIGVGAFEDNELSNINLPNVKELDVDAFWGNRIKKVKINETHSYDESAEKGTVGNPSINGAFGYQSWYSLKLPYQQEITHQELIEKVGLEFQVNGRNYLNNEVVTSSSFLDLNDNISSSGEQGPLKVDSEDGGSAIVYLDLSDKNTSDSIMDGRLSLAVNAKNGSVVPNPPLPPNPDNNTNRPEPDNNTSKPDTDNNNNATPSTPTTPGTSTNHPYSVYATRGMRLHKNVSLTSPVRSYKKQSRAKAPSFKIQGVAYDKNGKKRYKVNGGYITASSKYVADSHFRSSKVKRVRVIGNRVNSYKDAKLSKNQKVRSYKKGTKLNIRRIVNNGRTTRFQLTNGRYVTGNKQLLIMDQK